MKDLLSHLDDLLTFAGLAAYGVGLYGLSADVYVSITFVGLITFTMGLGMQTKPKG